MTGRTLVAIAAAALAAPTGAAASPDSPGAAAALSCAAATASDGARSARLLELLNDHRRSLGLPRLVTGLALSRSAAWKAWHMARHGYLAHADLPGRRTLAQRLRSCGFRGRGWGEVLAAGPRRPRAVVRAWLRSPAHRAVIELRSWRYAGAGAVRSRSGAFYWAVDFGA